MCADAVAPGWKHCKGEPSTRGKLPQATSTLFLNTCCFHKHYCELLMGPFSPIMELSLATLSFTMLLLLPCESRGARMLWRRMPVLFPSMHWLCNSGDWDASQRNTVCLYVLRKQRTCVCFFLENQMLLMRKGLDWIKYARPWENGAIKEPVGDYIVFVRKYIKIM